MDNADKYNIYVDASGDNGFNFSKDGTSACYTVAVFISKLSDENHNLNVLVNIKSALHAKIKDEVKYSTLRRHRNSMEAHKLLGTLKGTVLFFVACKKCCKQSEFNTGIIHSFPIDKVPLIVGENNINKIYIDRMKRPEEKDVENILTFDAVSSVDYGTKKVGEKVIFEDSKRIKNLQIADFFVGAIRHLFEKYAERPYPLPCKVCNMKRNLCRSTIKKQPIKHLNEVRCFSHLIYRDKVKERIILSGMYILPTKSTFNHLFIECFLRNK